MAFDEFATYTIGVLGTIGLCSMYLFDDRKLILLAEMVGTFFFVLHFIMLDAPTGAALNAVAFFSAVVYYQHGKKFFDHIAWMWVFVGVSIVAGVITWEGYYSIFPPLAMTLSLIGTYLKNTRLIRLLLFVSIPPWLVYNIIVGSVPGIVTEIIMLLFVISAIVRFDILKKEEKTKSL